MTDTNPIGVPQWSIDFWDKKRIKLDEIIQDLKKVRLMNSREPPRSIIKKLELFRDEEL